MRIEIPKPYRDTPAHRHFCAYGNHAWECLKPDPRVYGNWAPPVCVCPTDHMPMDEGDHSSCPIGNLACPEHHLAQIKQTFKDDLVGLEDVLSHQMTPSERLKSEEEHRFLDSVVFAGLTNLNTGFDSPLICHVTPEDFEAVIDRCDFLGVGINGIEAFSIDTWPSQHFVSYLGTWFAGEDCYKSAREILQHHLDMADESVAATFVVPITALQARGFGLDI